MIMEPGVVITQMAELDRVEFEPLGVTRPPLPQKYTHDCGACIYRGSLEVGGRHHDFYSCHNPVALGIISYLARYGPAGQEYISFPDVALRQMGTEPGSVEEVLRALCLFSDCQFKSVKYGFAVLPTESCSPGGANEIIILLDPLLEERRQIYIQDAIGKALNDLRNEPITPETLYKLRETISALVEQQIMERR